MTPRVNLQRVLYPVPLYPGLGLAFWYPRVYPCQSLCSTHLPCSNYVLVVNIKYICLLQYIARCGLNTYCIGQQTTINRHRCKMKAGVRSVAMADRLLQGAGDACCNGGQGVAMKAKLDAVAGSGWQMIGHEKCVAMVDGLLQWWTDCVAMADGLCCNGGQDVARCRWMQCCNINW